MYISHLHGANKFATLYMFYMYIRVYISHLHGANKLANPKEKGECTPDVQTHNRRIEQDPKHDSLLLAACTGKRNLFSK
jgi:hypothetical protein